MPFGMGEGNSHMTVSKTLDAKRVHRMCREESPLDIRHVLVDEAASHPSQANGIHNVARRLALEQRAAGDNARLVFLQSGVAGEFSELVPTEVLPLKGLAVGRFVVRLDRTVASELLAGVGRATRFHLHGGRYPVFVDIGGILHRRGIPFGLTVHGRYSHAYDQSGRARKLTTALYLSLMERELLVRARFVQALSPVEHRLLTRISPTARIETVGNGVYSSRLGDIPPAPKPRIRSTSFPSFSYCGRYAVAHKGLDLLVIGFALFRHRRGVGHLRMIGTGPDRERLTRMAADLGVLDAVEIGGPAFGSERDQVLRSCDFFVLASRFEGIPLAALEAASLCLPLIVSTGTGLRDVVEESGAGIGLRDATAEAVCEAMCAAADLSGQAYSRQAAAAYRMVLSSGDWTEIAARLRTLHAG